MAVTVLRTDGWMRAANCSSRPCSPDVYTVRVHARMLPKCLSMCDTNCSHSLSAKSDEETSDGLDEQDASRPLSVDG